MHRLSARLSRSKMSWKVGPMNPWRAVAMAGCPGNPRHVPIGVWGGWLRADAVEVGLRFRLPGGEL